jgi:hypothetical protein
VGESVGAGVGAVVGAADQESSLQPSNFHANSVLQHTIWLA